MKTILLVEDNANLCALYQEELGEIGYHTLQAASGREAVAQMTRHRLDLVVLDIDLRSQDGLDAMEQMLQNQPHLPVIINSSQGAGNCGFCPGAVAAFVLKSGDLTELLAQVERAMNRPAATVFIAPQAPGIA